MRNRVLVLIILSIIGLSCKKTNKTTTDNTSPKVKTDSSLAKITKPPHRLKTTNDFKTLLNSIRNIEDTGSKHSDWLTNNNTFFIGQIMNLQQDSFSLKTNSYEFKKDFVFYVHDLEHLNPQRNIKLYLEQIQTKYTKGSLEDRILIFTMKDDRMANFIDIPANWNHIKLKEELVEVLLEKIGSDIIICNRTKKCGYKDLRKTKPGG